MDKAQLPRRLGLAQQHLSALIMLFSFFYLTPLLEQLSKVSQAVSQLRVVGTQGLLAQLQSLTQERLSLVKFTLLKLQPSKTGGLQFQPVSRVPALQIFPVSSTALLMRDSA